MEALSEVFTAEVIHGRLAAACMVDSQVALADCMAAASFQAIRVPSAASMAAVFSQAILNGPIRLK